MAKRAFSILILVVFLFNLGGYYFFFWALRLHANQEVSALLDDGQYDESETFEIKIPLTIPYPLQANGFERISGQFEYRGEHYQIVKQKFENDVLTIVLLKDTKANQLTKASEAFSETSGSQPVKDGSLNVSIKVLQEFVSTLTAALVGQSGWSQTLEHTPYLNSHCLFILAKHSPPPKA
jgi:cbb3-type cytochrome oxidase subunit 3